MKLSICIPMYNEAEIVADTAIQLTEKMESFCRENPEFTYEIIFSDDGSTDNTSGMIPDFPELEYGEVIKTGYAFLFLATFTNFPRFVMNSPCGSVYLAGSFIFSSLCPN